MLPKKGKGLWDFVYEQMKRCTDNEQWVDVLGFDNKYQISNTGKLVCTSEKILCDSPIITLTRNKTERNSFKVDNIVIRKFGTIHAKGPEVWDTLDWNHHYQVSNYGRVKNIKVFDVMVSDKGSFVLISNKKRKYVSLVQLYIKAFPPYVNQASNRYVDNRPNVIK
jgi:hypothetical protein